MSAFDDLIAKLAERNLSDIEVDKIVNVGIGLASALGGGEEVLALLDSLKKQAEAKKQKVKSIFFIYPLFLSVAFLAIPVLLG